MKYNYKEIQLFIIDENIFHEDKFFIFEYFCVQIFKNVVINSRKAYTETTITLSRRDAASLCIQLSK